MSDIKPKTGVDAEGGRTVDPTRNVLDLVDAERKRQDDIRSEIIRRLDDGLQSIRDELQTVKDYLKDLALANDKRYEQRYEASQKALEAALVAQKDAVKEAFAAQKEAVSAALAGADRAVVKAETAAEKRFEGADKARLEQAEQQRTLMPRSEAESRLATLSEKLGVLEGFRTEILSRGTGTKEGYGWAIGMVGLVLTILTIIGAIFTLTSRVQ